MFKNQPNQGRRRVFTFNENDPVELDCHCEKDVYHRIISENNSDNSDSEEGEGFNGKMIDLFVLN
jgi:hypothetical protein